MKLPNLQVKNRIKKIEIQRFKGKNLKKRTLLILIAALLVLVALAGVGISKGLLKGPVMEAGAKKTEAVQEKQSGGETGKADDADLQKIKGRLAYDFIRTLRSDRYMIKYKTTTVYEGKSYEVETAYAVSGSSISLSSGSRATVVRDGKVYMLNHADKTALSWDVADSDDLKRIDTEGIAFVGSREESGLVCEEYQTAASGIKLYFDGKNPVRMETTINKIDTVMDITGVSKEVPESLFAVPADYDTTNID